MTALEIIGMILLLFLLLSMLRVGVIVDFGGELRVRLRVGPVKLTVLPRKDQLVFFKKLLLFMVFI